MTTLAQLTIATPSNDTAVNASGLLDLVKGQVIAAADDYELMALFLRDVKAQRNRVDDERKRIKRPIDEAARAVQAFFARPLAFLDEAEALAKRKLLAYDAEQQRIRVEKQREADEAARVERAWLEQQGNAEAAATVVAPIVESNVPKVAGLSKRESWHYRVVNEDLIPREYLCIDEPKLAAIVRAMKSKTNIPGIEAYNEPSAASRS